MFKRVYVEITNICNLNCSFCHGTKRAQKMMNENEFDHVISEVKTFTKYIYFHIMGEPLIHPNLEKFLKKAAENNLNVCITTNGMLIRKCEDILINAEALDKVSISLHSFEANECKKTLSEYMEDVWEFAVKMEEAGKKCALRLWNEGGKNSLNKEIEEFLSRKIGEDVAALKRDPNGNRRLGKRIFLESAEKFDWPDIEAENRNTQFCHALRQQIGILSNGTVVPCCLDADGEIDLGNIFEERLEDILKKERTRQMIEGFSRRQPSEELCRRCGYAERFSL